MAQSVFLIGNGYNLFLRDYYRERDIDLSQAIERTCSLWNSFANALSPLVGQTPPPVAREIRDNDLNSEQTAQLLYDMLDFATGMQAFTSDTSLRKSVEVPGCTGVCVNSLESLLDSTLYNTIHQFVDDETQGIYGRLFSAASPGDLQGLQRLFSSISNRTSLFTTNYDGLFDITLGFEGFQQERNEFTYKDGFGSIDDLPGLYFPSPNSACDNLEHGLRAHLHGSYNFIQERTTDGFRMCRKIRRREYGVLDRLLSAAVPVLVFDAPSRKRTRIDRFPVLMTYYAAFEHSLLHASTLVIFGQSLANDPHLSATIWSNWIDSHDGMSRSSSSSTDATMTRHLVVVDKDPNAVLTTLAGYRGFAADQLACRLDYRPVSTASVVSINLVVDSLRPLLTE